MRRLLLRLISWLPVAALVFGVATTAYLHVRYSPLYSTLTEDRLLHISDDGQWLLTCPSKNAQTESVRVWNTRNGKVLATYFDTPHECAVSPYQELLIGFGADETMRIGDWRTGNTKTVAIGDAVKRFFFVGHWCVVRPSSSDWALVNLENGCIELRFPARSYVQSSHDGRWLFVRGDSIERWDLAKMRMDIELPVTCQRIDGRGRWLGAWKTDAEHIGSWTVWDMNTGRPRHHFAKLSWLSFSEDGARMAVIRADRDKKIGALQVMDAQSGRVLLNGTVPYGADFTVFSADNQQVCVTGGNPELASTTMIDVATGKVIWHETHNGTFLPDKNVVLPAFSSGTFREANTGNVLFRGDWIHCTSDRRFIVIRNDTTSKDSHWRWLAPLLPAVFGDGELLQLIELDSMREVYRVRHPANPTRPECVISMDGGILVTRRIAGGSAQVPTYQIEVWDTSLWRSQMFAGMTGGGAVLVLLGIRWWRYKRPVSTP